MKSTYKLLSIFLDNQDLPKSIPQFIDIPELSEYSEVGEECNLFDFPICRRKISGLKLLSAESTAEIASFINELVECEEILVILDYNSTSKIASALYLKRVLQAIVYLSKARPGSVIILAGDKWKWTEQLKEIYTR